MPSRQLRMLPLLLFVVVAAAVAGAATSFAVLEFVHPSEDALISEFYAIETAVHVSPHSLRGKMDKGDTSFVLVDLRSREEYDESHIIGAVSIPAYSDRYTSAYDEAERIVSAFAALPPGKDIIVYCYSIPCMTGRKIGKMLAEHSTYVQHLGVGWNEWRHGWTQWNHEHEWNTTSVNDYIWSGSEPGTPLLRDMLSPCGLSETFGC